MDSALLLMYLVDILRRKISFTSLDSYAIRVIIFSYLITSKGILPVALNVQLYFSNFDRFHGQFLLVNQTTVDIHGHFIYVISMHKLRSQLMNKLSEIKECGSESYTVQCYEPIRSSIHRSGLSC